MRPTEAHVRAAAIRGNLERLSSVAPNSTMCAVVKADGYGHGALTAATAALDSSATWLAVATLEEAVELREGGIGERVPILVLSELEPGELDTVPPETAAGLRLTIGSDAGARAVVDAASGAHRSVVHLKVDTGMHRVGVQPAAAPAVADMLAAAPGVELEGVWTHLAVADDPADEFTAEQLSRFDEVVAELAAHGHVGVVLHCANSAGLIAHPAAHRDMVRVGIAMYGIAPDPALSGRVPLEPALSLVSRVRAVRTVETGEGVSYGRRWRADGPTLVATVPIGYADGIRRSSPTAGVEVLVRGRRRPMLGVVTMDQLMIAVDADVHVGDEVILIGRQAAEEITATEIAQRLGTIGYEVVTTIGPRVPRRVVG